MKVRKGKVYTKMYTVIRSREKWKREREEIKEKENKGSTANS